MAYSPCAVCSTGASCDCTDGAVSTPVTANVRPPSEACAPEPEAVVGDSLVVSVPLPQPLPDELVGAADFDVLVLGPDEAWTVSSLWMNTA